MKHGRQLCGLTGLLVLVTGCEGGTGAGSTGQSSVVPASPVATSSASSTTASTTTSPSPTASASATSSSSTSGNLVGSGTVMFTPARTWSWDTLSSGGYRNHVVMSVGTPSKASQIGGALQNNGGCFVSAADAVIPVTTTTTENTPNFGDDVATLITVNDQAEQWNYLHVGDSGLTECDQGGLNADCQLTQGKTCTGSGYIVVSNYYTPDQPSGDAKALHMADGQPLALVDQVTDTNQGVTLTGWFGPTVTAKCGPTCDLPGWL